MFTKTAGAAGIAIAFSAAAGAVMPAAAESTASIETYDPAWFETYSPSTALDMVHQVPGFSISDGASVRGFGGAAGNVLLNGQRPSSKTSLSETLKRVPAESVARIELVTGASADFDMRGQSKVVNVVIRDTGGRSPVTAELLTILAPDNQVTARISASTQLALFGGSLTVAGEYGNRSGDSRENLTRDVFDANGVLQTRGAGWKDVRPMNRKLSLDFERPVDWGYIRLNGSLSPYENTSHRHFDLRDPSTDRLRGAEANEGWVDEFGFTLGGDIQRDFIGGSAKLVTYHARRNGDYASAFSTFDAAGAFISTTTTRPEKSSGESILRGQIDWAFGESHAVQIAAEGAYNFLDSLTGYERRTPSGSTQLFIDGSDTTVEEYRGEVQLSDVWTVTPALTIEPGFRIEMSRIEQAVRFQNRDDVEAQRAFTYPKPFVSASWRIDPDRNLRVSLERKVAQLSFNDFVSSVELVNDQTTSGNPDLEPEQTWALDASLEQSFWKTGVITLSGSWDGVEAVQDYMPVGSGASITDAPGNIGDGERWSLGMKLSAPFDTLGLANARLDVALSAGSSSVTDPATLETRRFSGEYAENLDVSWRHDFPQQKFSYGFSWNDGGPAWTYRLGETSRVQRLEPEVGAWIETTATAGLRTRLGVNNVTSTGTGVVRTMYAGPRSSSSVTSIWDSTVSSGLRCFLSIAGNF